jgi:ATP-binding cassette subfamily F protein uup
MAALLTVRGLAKHFAARTLFTGVSLSIEERERLALIGPNGAGKSTLIKILAGTEDHDGGTVTARRGLRAAYVAQADAFPKGATVRSAVMAELESAMKAGKLPHLHDHHELELAADMTIDRVGVADLAGTPCEKLSGGQRKRVSIARALAQDPWSSPTTSASTCSTRPRGARSARAPRPSTPSAAKASPSREPGRTRSAPRPAPRS